MYQGQGTSQHHTRALSPRGPEFLLGTLGCSYLPLSFKALLPCPSSGKAVLDALSRASPCVFCLSSLYSLYNIHSVLPKQEGAEIVQQMPGQSSSPGAGNRV